MGKTHDDDEVEIDLRELYYALKKRVLVILAAVLAGAGLPEQQQSFDDTCLQRNIYNACSHKGNNTFFTG